MRLRHNTIHDLILSYTPSFSLLSFVFLLVHSVVYFINVWNFIEFSFLSRLKLIRD